MLFVFIFHAMVPDSVGTPGLIFTTENALTTVKLSLFTDSKAEYM